VAEGQQQNKMKNPLFKIDDTVKINLPYDVSYNNQIGKIRDVNKQYDGFTYIVEIKTIFYNGREVSMINVDEKYLK